MASIHYVKDDEVYTSDAVNDNWSFIVRNMCALALDGITVSEQDNIKVDLFTSDTASSTTHVSYDAGNDLYKCDTGAGTGTCVLESGTTAISSGHYQACVLTDSVISASTTLAIEVSFDGGDNYSAVTEGCVGRVQNTGSVLKLRFTFTRLDTASSDSITGYAVYYG